MPSVFNPQYVATLHAKLFLTIVHHWYRYNNPFVLIITNVFFFLVIDINQTVLQRFELKSRALLIDEQSNSR